MGRRWLVIWRHDRGHRLTRIDRNERATCGHCRPFGVSMELAPAQPLLAADSNAQVPALAWRCGPFPNLVARITTQVNH